MNQPAQLALDWLAEASAARTVTHPPRARARDPVTSAQAAERSHEFSGQHECLITKAIETAGELGATAKEIARSTGLTDVQVNRRLHAIPGIGRRLRNGATSQNDYERRGGCAVWWKR